MSFFFRLLCTSIFCLWLSPKVVSQCNTQVEAGPDQTLCAPGGTVPLQGQINGPFDFFEWTPPLGLSNPNALNPTATVTTTTTYTLSAYGLSNNNLIVNGDFEQGNTGFTSDYMYHPTNLIPEGRYTVITSPSLVHSNFPPCDDHTFMNGTGNMMAVNGAGQANVNVWCQTVPVNPNTYYEFSAWVMTIIPIAPAQLQFSVNGQLLGNVFQASNTPCQWTEFNETWFSGGATSATICIVNQNTALVGNDFGLDDISFFEYCENRDSVTVEVIPNVEVFLDEYVCAGECFFIGNTPYCFSGSYTQTLSGASVNGCDSVVNLNLTVLQPSAIALPPDPLSCYNNFVTTLDGSLSSFGPNVSYSWTGPNGFSSNLASPTVTSPGTYTLEVTITEGGVSCSETTQVDVLQYDNVPIADAGADTTLGCDITEVPLDGTQSSLGQNIVYEWENENGVQVSNSILASTDQPGIYTLIVTDQQSGCTATDDVVIADDSQAPQVSVQPDTFRCSDTSVLLTAIAPQTDLTYNWTGPGGFQALDSVAQHNLPGTYALTVTASNGCTNVVIIEVPSDTLSPTFALSDTSLSCADSTAPFFAPTDTSLSHLSWTGPQGFLDSGLVVHVSHFGTYQLEAMAPNGCLGQATAQLLPDTVSPSFQLQADTLDCLNPSADLTAQSPDPNAWFVWTGPGSFQDTGAVVTVTNAGTYTATAFAENGCSRSAMIAVVPSADLPELDAQGGTLTCLQDTLALVASSNTPGTTINWEGPNGWSSSLWSPAVSIPGTYTATVTAPNGCVQDTAIFIGIDTLPPNIQVADSLLTCTVSSLSPRYSADSSVQLLSWFGPGGFSYSGSDPSIQQPGAYALQATATNGCFATDSFSIQENTTPPQAQLSVDTFTCSDTLLPVTGTYSTNQLLLDWQGPNGFQSDDAFPTLNQPGSYWLELTDTVNGCRDTFALAVESDTALPVILGVVDDTLTCMENMITLQGNTLSPVAVYAWTGGSGNLSYVNQPIPNPTLSLPGDYTLTATGFNGCEADTTIRVSMDTIAPDLLVLGDTLSCASPQVWLQGISNSATEYEWSGPAGVNTDSAALSTSTPGIYSLLVTAGNGCTRMATFPLEADTLPPFAEADGDTLSCNENFVSLTGNVDPGLDSLFWAGPNGFSSTELSPDVFQTGIYVLTAVAENGCVSQDTANVWADEAIPQATVEGGVLTCAQPQLNLQADIQTPGAMGEWTGPNGFNSSLFNPVISEAGDYLLTVTGTNGCSASFSAQVDLDTVAPQLALNADTLTCATPVIPLQAQVLADSILSVQWQGPNGFSTDTLQAVVPEPGLYELTVVASNGCTQMAAIEVWENVDLPDLTIQPDTISCSQSQVNVNASAPPGNFTYSWTGPQGIAFSGLSPTVSSPGLYTLEVQVLNNGCRDTILVPVPADTAAPVFQVSGDTISCNTPSVQLSVQPAPADWNYSWNGPAGFTSSQVTPQVTMAGNFTLVVTATNGCMAEGQAPVVADTLSPDLQVQGVHLNCFQPDSFLSAETDPGSFISWWAGSVQVGSGNTLAVSQAGTWVAISTASNGCTNTASVEATEDFDVPSISTQGDTLTCVRVTGTLSASSPDPGVAFTWTGPGVFMVEEPTVSVDEGGDYEVIATAPNGCTTSEEVSLEVDQQPPFAEAGSGGVLNCIIEQVDLEGNLAPGQMGRWLNAQGNTLATESSFIVTQPGWYFWELTTERNGCTAVDSVQVTENPAVPTGVETEVRPPDCPGGSNGEVWLQAIEGGTPPYQFQLQGQAIDGLGQFVNLSAGTYALTVEDAIGCTFSLPVTVPEAEPMELELPEEITIHFTEEAELEPIFNFDPSDITDIEWTPTDFLSCADCLYPRVSELPHTWLYQLTLTREGGCTVSARTLVRVLKDRHVFLPNVFSPGLQDGYNDWFFVTARPEEVATIREFRIFNRWGEQLFARQNFPPNSPELGWDGTFGGEPVNPGVFVYLIEIEFVDGVVELYKGDITVVK